MNPLTPGIPTTAGPDWMLPTPRPLPIRVAPAHRETLNSYIGRLAAANRLDPAALRAHIAGASRRSAPLPLPRLCSVTGQPAQTLQRALPELHQSPRALAVDRSARLECQHCAASRGRSNPATVGYAGHHDAVCHKHRLWLGDGHTGSTQGQPTLNRHPQILRANLTHRRLVRRHGLIPVDAAYREAARVCRNWHEYREHDEQFIDLLTIFHGPRWILPTSDPTIPAARYPQIVALTRLLASPYWRAQADQDNPARFVTEIQRTVAPQYKWSLASHYRRYDPLVEALGHHQRWMQGPLETK